MRDRTTVQTVTMLYGAVFLAVGILGFIPGITTDYGDLSFAGDGSEAKLLGIFQVSILHNIVHLLFGIAGIALARTFETARTYLLGAGLIYIVLFVYGLFVGNNDSPNFVPINNADDLLHLVLGIALLGSWYISREGAPTTATTAT